MDLRSRPGFVGHEVTTRNGCRDLAGWATGGLASRPEMDVATWLDGRQEVWRRDQGF